MLLEQAIQRMEGLTNLAANETLQESASTIYEDLEDEGFDREDILQYLRLIIEGACVPR